MKKYTWHKQTLALDFDLIQCPSFDDIKDFRRDPPGFYVLIRCDAGLIEVAICDKKHVIIKVFRGKRAQDLYFTIFEYEKRHKLNWFTRKDHAAYLGKELKKCEYALLGNETYVQE